MIIKTINNQLRNDLYGQLECESCGAEEKFVGYNDSYWHAQVLPARKCKSCGKSRADMVARVGDIEQVE